MPLALVGSVAAIGWRGTWWALAAIVLLFTLPIVLVLLRGHDRRQADYRSRLADTAAGDGQRHWRQREVLRHPVFHALLPAVMAPPFIITALFFHQVPLADEQGWSLQWLATSFLAFGAAHVVALLLSGPLVDRIGARRLVPTYLLPIVAGLALLDVGMAPSGVALLFAVYALLASVIAAFALRIEKRHAAR